MFFLALVVSELCCRSVMFIQLSRCERGQFFVREINKRKPATSDIVPLQPAIISVDIFFFCLRLKLYAPLGKGFSFQQILYYKTKY